MSKKQVNAQIISKYIELICFLNPKQLKSTLEANPSFCNDGVLKVRIVPVIAFFLQSFYSYHIDFIVCAPPGFIDCLLHVIDFLRLHAYICSLDLGVQYVLVSQRSRHSGRSDLPA